MFNRENIEEHLIIADNYDQIDISDIQKMLTRLGYRMELLNGDALTKSTRSIIKKYQKDHHLKETGYISAELYELLSNKINELDINTTQQPNS